jgi:CRP/FNR family transcriptional regulator, anaerobic regulatory protein
MTVTYKMQELFPSLEKELLDEMENVGEIKHFPEGAVLMRTGQYIRSTILVLEGLLKVYREDVDGGEFFMYYLEGGKACALSMICTTTQQTSELMLKAVSDVTVMVLPLSVMDQWMMKYRTWYLFVMGTYRERFEELLLTIDSIAFRNMDERLAFYLHKQQKKLGTPLLELTHNEIASDLNTSREVVSRLLKKMADKGMVRIQRQQIEILDIKLT